MTQQILRTTIEVDFASIPIRYEEINQQPEETTGNFSGSRIGSNIRVSFCDARSTSELRNKYALLACRVISRRTAHSVNAYLNFAALEVTEATMGTCVSKRWAQVDEDMDEDGLGMGLLAGESSENNGIEGGKKSLDYGDLLTAVEDDKSDNENGFGSLARKTDPF